MKTSDIQSVSTSQNHSIHSTNRKLWASTHDISEPESPSSLSANSEGIPDDLRQLFEVRLQAKNPTFYISNPWPINLVQDVAEVHFQRNKFTDKLFHLPALEIGRRHEEDEDDDDSDDDYDSEEDEDYEDELCRQRRRPIKKKPKAQKKPFRNLPSIQIRKEEPSRRIVPPAEESGMEGIIHQLNTMSLENPQYGALYYKAVNNDHSGLVAQCINRRPKQLTNNRINREPPPHQEQPIRPPYFRGILPQMPGQNISNNTSKCFGCFETGHQLCHCPKMGNMVYKGIVTLDSNLKYRLQDGGIIPRRPEESLMEAIERVQSTQNQVQFVTIRNAVADYYNKEGKRRHSQYKEDSEQSDEEYLKDEIEDDSEEEEFQEAHWKRRADRRQLRQEVPAYMAYEAIDENDYQQAYHETYPAERSDKTTHQARSTAMNRPVRKMQFDGVYMPPRRPRGPLNASEKNPEKILRPDSVPSKPVTYPPNPIQSKENAPPIVSTPIPVDARKPRFKEIPDVIMKDIDQNTQENTNKKPITLQTILLKTIL